MPWVLDLDRFDVRDDVWELAVLSLVTQQGVSPDICLLASHKLQAWTEPAMLDPDEDPVPVLLEIVEDFARHKEVNHLPTKLLVNDERAVGPLREVLPDAVDVQFRPSLGLAKMHLADALENPPEFPRIPGLDGPRPISSNGVTEQDLRTFAQAGVDFLTRAPWQDVPAETLFRVRRPKPMVGMHYLSVMGQGGQEFGLSFYARQRDFHDLMAQTGPVTGDGPRPSWGVSLDSIDDINIADAHWWNEWNLPIADHPTLGRRFPNPIGFSPEGHLVRPTGIRLRYLSHLLTLFARAVSFDDHVSGQEAEVEVIAS
jgi:hypothetical protein